MRYHVLIPLKSGQARNLNGMFVPYPPMRLNPFEIRAGQKPAMRGSSAMRRSVLIPLKSGQARNVLNLTLKKLAVGLNPFEIRAGQKPIVEGEAAIVAS